MDFHFILFQEDGLSSAELIFYDRPDQAGPKFSDYHTTKITEPEDLRVNIFSLKDMVLYPSLGIGAIYTFGKSSLR